MTPGEAEAAVPAGNDKIAIEARINLGTALELRQHADRPLSSGFRMAAGLPMDGSLLAVDINPASASGGMVGAEQLTWQFEPTDKPVDIRDKGLTESYMIFGAPGSGKTYMLMYLLKQLFALHSGDAQRKVGGLILDPKAALIEDVREMMRLAGREDDLVIINSETLEREKKNINLIDAGLDPVELGTMLVLAAQAAGTDASEPFWFGAWSTLFGAATLFLSWADEWTVTLASLLSAVLDVAEKTPQGRPLRKIEVMIRDSRLRLAGLPPGERRDMELAIADIEGFYRQEADNIATVETLMRRAYSGFLRSKWQRYSGASPNLKGTAPSNSVGGGSTFYDRIIDDGKIVLVSVSPSEPMMAKVICTLVKVLFQRTILSRLDRVRSGSLKNFERLVVMAVDEYSAVASEIQGQPMGDGLFFSQCRQNGCIGLVATQSVNLLQSSSLKENWKAIVSVCAAKIYMRLADNETAEDATKLAGEYDWYLTSRGTSQQKDGASSSTNTDQRERKALPAAVLTQILKMGQGAMVGSLDGKKSQDTLRFFQTPRWS
jgi:type IV secretory system conjugative DNA transfer VirD4/TraG family protein